MTMIIHTNGRIHLDGQDIGLHVTQRGNGTVLYRPEPYQEIPLPHLRYSLAHATPASGNPGREQFEADVRAYLVAP